MSGWLNMSNRRLHHSLSMVYKIINNLVPAYLIDPITSIIRPNYYDTRNKNLPIPFSQSHIKSSSFYCSSINRYNSLPNTIKSSSSLNVFKSNVKLYLKSMQHSGVGA